LKGKKLEEKMMTWQACDCAVRGRFGYRCMEVSAASCWFSFM